MPLHSASDNNLVFGSVLASSFGRITCLSGKSKHKMQAEKRKVSYIFPHQLQPVRQSQKRPRRNCTEPARETQHDCTNPTLSIEGQENLMVFSRTWHNTQHSPVLVNIICIFFTVFNSWCVAHGQNERATVVWFSKLFLRRPTRSEFVIEPNSKRAQNWTFESHARTVPYRSTRTVYVTVQTGYYSIMRVNVPSTVPQYDVRM